MGGPQRHQGREILFQILLPGIELARRLAHLGRHPLDHRTAARHMIIALPHLDTATAHLGGKPRQLLPYLLAVIESDGTAVGGEKREGRLVKQPVGFLLRLGHTATLQQIAKAHQIVVTQHQIGHGMGRIAAPGVESFG